MKDGTFDVAICESVVAFVTDKQQAVNELTRVVRPGGHVGFTEATWKPEATADTRAYMSGISGVKLMTHDEWQAFLRRAGLQAVVAEMFPVKLRHEARDQFRRNGRSDIARALGRLGGHLLSSARYRSYVRDALKMPSINKVINHIGYGVYAGRKPA